MTRKYINRKTNFNDNKISSNNEWDTIDDLNKNLEIQEVADVSERDLFLNDEPEKPKTHWEKTKDATRNAMDRAGNTSQYMKYVNEHFTKQHSKINEIKKLQEKFDNEVNLLRNDTKENQNDNLIKHKTQNVRDLINAKSSLLKEKNITRAYLNELKKEILKTEKNIQNIDNQIHDIEKNL